jgi:4-hydroxyphenylpyruvate dioxygenase
MTVPQNEDIFPSKMGPEYVGFDHIHWFVGNPKQAASYWITRMGFRPIAYRGPETGSPYIVSYIVANGDATFILTGPVCGPPKDGADSFIRQASHHERTTLVEIHEHLTVHGDGVKDVAFRIAGDIEAVWKRAVGNGARSIAEPRTVAVDGHGLLISATIGTYGDTVHSLVNREEYSKDAPFLPGYRITTDEDPITQLLPAVNLLEIDHCVGNQSWGGVDSIVQ